MSGDNPTNPNWLDPKDQDWLNEDDWNDFLAFRREIGKPMGDTAKRRMLKKLYRMREAGEDISEAIDQSIRNRWQDVWPVKPDQKPPPQKEFYEAKEPEITEEQRQKNLERIHEMAQVVNISGDRRK